MSTDTTSSRAGSLPQGFEVIHASVKRMPRAVDGFYSMFTPQLPITLHQKPTTARQPLLAAGPVSAGQVVPGQPRQFVMHQMKIEVQEQPAPWPRRFIEHGALLRRRVRTMLIVGTNHGDRQRRHTDQKQVVPNRQ